MIKAFFVDFYGTIVHEDGEVIKKITKIICDTGKVEDPSDIDGFWWKDFQTMFMNAYGETFETQRALEEKSLVHTLAKFSSNANAKELSEMMFAHWVKPPIFEDSHAFFDKSPLPIYIVSNIDRNDVLEAIAYHNLHPAGVFTSEDARSYKPRRELFELALRETGLKPDEVIHIGDSVSSDVNGAGALGIKTLWLNRFGKAVPEGTNSIATLTQALDLADLENRRLERKIHERKTLESLGHPEYFEMLDFVREQLGEGNTEYSKSGKIDISYSRYDHTKRVLSWVLKLYRESARKSEIRFDELVIATIFHDVGRRKADDLRIPHALAGVSITREYLEGRGETPEKIDYVCDLVARHSDKHCMHEEGLDAGLLMLMEADLLDDMGAQGIVMDCMITESRNPDARFEDCLDHMTRYTLRQQEERNPMVSSEAIAAWDEKTRLTRKFVEALRNDLIL